jgi:hypothetical protein
MKYRTPAFVAGCAGLALSMSTLAQQADPQGQVDAGPAIAQPTVSPMKDTGRRGVVPHLPGIREAFADPDLTFVAANSDLVIDATLVHKRTFIPEGMRTLMTEYTFQTNEWFKGGRGVQLMTFMEAGGEDPQRPGGMTTCRSHRLEIDGRYILFARTDAAHLPFNRVLQVAANGVLTDESGRIVTGVSGGILQVRSTAEGRSLSYFPGARHHVPAPERELQPLPIATMGEVIPVDPVPVNNDPMPLAEFLRLLRPAGAQAPAGIPMGLPLEDPTDHRRCGFLTGSMNYRYLMPDNNNWSWTQAAMVDWNQIVTSGGNSTWVFGNIVTGNPPMPIRNELPVANNNRNNCGVPSNAQMSAGGYSTWTSLGANGVCYRWYDSSCGRIRETDVFANPSIGANELQFRKTMVHELGHALGLDHEDRYVAIMVSGTWRVPPNYSSNDYLRGDDIIGGRASMTAGNSNTSGSWVLNNAWRDMLTVSQSHPNWGSAGDVGTHMTRLSTYSANGGQSVQLQRMFIENRGPQSFPSTLTLRVYLSTNNIISTADTQVASMTWPSYGAFGFSNNFNISFTVPTTIPTGNYYVGWILSTPDSELETANNTGILMGAASAGFAELTLAVNNTPAVPGNNTCTNAINVSSGGSFNGTTVGATNTASATCGSSASSPDVWYSFTAPCTGTLQLDTCGTQANTGFDTVLAVYSSCGGTQLACNDDHGGAGGGSCGLRDSFISLPVTAGTNYRIRVAGFNNTTGAFTLRVNMAEPANNACANAIQVGNGSTPFATCGATTDGPNEPGACNFFSYTQIGNDVWYRYTATCTGIVTIDLCNANYDTKMAVYGASCPTGSGQLIACNDDSCGLRSEISFAAVQGQSYRIRIGGYNGARGSGTMNISCSPLSWTSMPLPPFNNTFSDATRTRGLWFQAPTGMTITGLRVPDEANHGLQNVEVVRLPNDPPVFPANLGTGNFTSLGRYIARPSAAIIPADIVVNPGDYIGILGACGDATVMHNSYANVSTFNTTIFGQATTLRPFGMQYNLVTNPADEVWTTTTVPIARIQVYYSAPPSTCYANCDGSTTAPILNVADFSCFLSKFAAGDPYANCDGSTTPPVLNVADFSCFLGKFAAGCP